jgi:hypothetical protein
MADRLHHPKARQHHSCLASHHLRLMTFFDRNLSQVVTGTLIRSHSTLKGSGPIGCDRVQQLDPPTPPKHKRTDSFLFQSLFHQSLSINRFSKQKSINRRYRFKKTKKIIIYVDSNIEPHNQVGHYGQLGYYAILGENVA